MKTIKKSFKREKVITITSSLIIIINVSNSVLYVIFKELLMMSVSENKAGLELHTNIVKVN